MEDKTKLMISDFVGLEMSEDIRDNGYYKNAIEVAGLIRKTREQLTETLEEIDSSYDYLWELTKADRPIKRQLVMLEKYAIDLAYESIMLAMICRKGKLINEKEDE